MRHLRLISPKRDVFNLHTEKGDFQIIEDALRLLFLRGR